MGWRKFFFTGSSFLLIRSRHSIGERRFPVKFHAVFLPLLQLHVRRCAFLGNKRGFFPSSSLSPFLFLFCYGRHSLARDNPSEHCTLPTFSSSLSSPASARPPEGLSALLSSLLYFPIFFFRTTPRRTDGVALLRPSISTPHFSSPLFSFPYFVFFWGRYFSTDFISPSRSTPVFAIYFISLKRFLDSLQHTPPLPSCFFFSYPFRLTPPLLHSFFFLPCFSFPSSLRHDPRTSVETVGRCRAPSCSHPLAVALSAACPESFIQKLPCLFLHVPLSSCYAIELRTQRSSS